MLLGIKLTDQIRKAMCRRTIWFGSGQGQILSTKNVYAKSILEIL